MRTFAQVAEDFRRPLYPAAIGSKRIVDVRRSDVAKLHGALGETPCQANKALALISAIWNWAARRDEVALADNPSKCIERCPEQGREPFHVDLRPFCVENLQYGREVKLYLQLTQSRPSLKRNAIAKGDDKPKATFGPKH